MNRQTFSHFPSRAALDALRAAYQPGVRVRLLRMEDPYTKLAPGATGSVDSVDDAGTIHVRWDCGSTLGVVYGVDAVALI